MGDARDFATDVFRAVCDRFADLKFLVDAGASFEDWLTWEAFLACKLRQESYPFCEVVAKPTYASEGVGVGGDPEGHRGDLRVGGPNDGADHCWVFAEFVLIHEDIRTGGEWMRKIEAAADRLRRLGWKKSAALLVVVVAIRGDGVEEWGDDLAGCAVWNRPALTDPFVIALPGGGMIILRAFDIKQYPTDTLTASPR